MVERAPGPGAGRPEWCQHHLSDRVATIAPGRRDLLGSPCEVSATVTRGELAAARMCSSAHRRRHRRSLVAATLIVAFSGAVFLATVAGARRSDSAFERMKAETRAAQLRVFGPAIDHATLDRLRALPGVVEVGRGQQLVANVNGGFQAFGAVADDRLGRTVEVPRLLDGRRAASRPGRRGGGPRDPRERDAPRSRRPSRRLRVLAGSGRGADEQRRPAAPARRARSPTPRGRHHQGPERPVDRGQRRWAPPRDAGVSRALRRRDRDVRTGGALRAAVRPRGGIASRRVPPPSRRVGQRGIR